jgi:predicted TIM-barrel fold metal-dependent hydrolase
VLIDMHTHPFGVPSYRNLGDKIRTVPDLIAFRTRFPDLYEKRLTEAVVDYVDELVADMDRHEVGLAVIQPTGGRGTNEAVAEAVKKHPGRLFGLLRLGHDQEAGGYVDDPAPVRDSAPEIIHHYVREKKPIGMGELPVRAFTTEIHPERVAKDLAKIMDTLAEVKVPLMIPTGWTQFPGNLYFADPIFVDEIAGRHPTVPIVLTKMGRGIDHYFESCIAVAMRNPNVYFDTLTTTAAHLRRAVDTIGAHRIMFGSDWSPTWRWVREPAELYTLRLKPIRDADLAPQDAEQILWKTAATLFQLPTSGVA